MMLRPNGRVTFRMFAACKAGECHDCMSEMLVSDRRDGEPAIEAGSHVERCGCDCHGWFGDEIEVIDERPFRDVRIDD